MRIERFSMCQMLRIVCAIILLVSVRMNLKN